MPSNLYSTGGLFFAIIFLGVCGVAGMGPFIDTIIVCTMTALVLLATGVWNRPAAGHVTEY